MEIQNLELWQGDTWDIQVTVYDADNLPLDLTSWNIRSSIRKKYSDAVKTKDFTCSKVDAVNGILKLHLAAVDTDDLAKGSYVYDVELYKTVETEEYVYKPVGGRITVNPEATKAA